MYARQVVLFALVGISGREVRAASVGPFQSGHQAAGHSVVSFYCRIIWSNKRVYPAVAVEVQHILCAQLQRKAPDFVFGAESEVVNVISVCVCLAVALGHACRKLQAACLYIQLASGINAAYVSLCA